MVNYLLVKQVLRQFPFTGLQMKVIAWRKCKHGPQSLTARTITSDCIVQVCIDFVADGTALATAFIM